MKPRLTELLAWLALAAIWLGGPAHGASALEESARAAAERGDLALAERLLSDRLSEAPEDRSARSLRARVRSWAGRWDESADDYDRLLEVDRQDADILLGRAQVWLWSGSPREAAATAAEARRLAPDYEAVWRLELQALRAAGDPAAERAAEALTRDAQARFPQTSWAQSSASPDAGPTLRIGARVGAESLDNGLARWSSTGVEAAHEAASGRVVFGRVASTERFELRDREYGAGVQMPVGDRWRAELELAYSPTGAVLPEHTLSVGIRRSLSDGWSVAAQTRRAQYSETHASVTTVGVEKYLRDFRFAYQLFRGKAEGARATLSRAARVDYYYGIGHAVGLLVVSGREQESLGGGLLIDTQVDAFALLGEQSVGPDWAVTWSVGRHQQGALYRRDGGDVGFRHRF